MNDSHDFQVHPAVRLRRAVAADAEFVLSLSNDPQVRAGSLNGAHIAREDHFRWFDARLKDADTVFYIVETAEGTPVGQVRFQRTDGEWISSMSLTAAVRGRGLSAGLLREAMRKAGLRRIVGFVKLDNERSYRMALASGYADEGTVDLRGQACHRMVFGRSTFVIAEMSANHRGDLGRAKELVRAAKACGADAVKIQTYTADSMTLDSDQPPFVVTGGTLWDGRRLYDVYREAATPWAWTEPLMELADSLGIELFSTPFDRESVDFLEGVGVRRYKIASFEAVDLPLVRYAAAKGRPMLVSTGVCSPSEIEAVVAACRAEGNDDLTLMKCTSAYPAKLETLHVSTIADMVSRFGGGGVRVGLSDHSLGIESVVAAVALGATALEKHLTLDRPEGDAEASFSLTPEEFAATVRSVRNVEAALGEVSYDVPPAARKFCRSLFVAEDVRAGELLTERNVRSLRPGAGCAPSLLPQILGRTAVCDLKRGTPMKMEFCR